MKTSTQKLVQLTLEQHRGGGGSTCLTHNEAKQTEKSDFGAFGAEKRLLQDHLKAK